MSSVGNVPFSKWSPIVGQHARVDEGADGALDGALFGGEVAGEIEEVGHGPHVLPHCVSAARGWWAWRP